MDTRETYWYADEDNERGHGDYRWVPVLQSPGFVLSLDLWHLTKEDCEAFILTIPAGTEISR